MALNMIAVYKKNLGTEERPPELISTFKTYADAKALSSFLNRVDGEYAYYYVVESIKGGKRK